LSFGHGQIGGRVDVEEWVMRLGIECNRRTQLTGINGASVASALRLIRPLTYGDSPPWRQQNLAKYSRSSLRLDGPRFILKKGV